MSYWSFPGSNVSSCIGRQGSLDQMNDFSPSAGYPGQLLHFLSSTFLDCYIGVLLYNWEFILLKSFRHILNCGLLAFSSWSSLTFSIEVLRDTRTSIICASVFFKWFEVHAGWGQSLDCLDAAATYFTRPSLLLYVLHASVIVKWCLLCNSCTFMYLLYVFWARFIFSRVEPRRDA